MSEKWEVYGHPVHPSLVFDCGADGIAEITERDVSDLCTMRQIDHDAFAALVECVRKAEVYAAVAAKAAVSDEVVERVAQAIFFADSVVSARVGWRSSGHAKLWAAYEGMAEAALSVPEVAASFARLAVIDAMQSEAE